MPAPHPCSKVLSYHFPRFLEISRSTNPTWFALIEWLPQRPEECKEHTGFTPDSVLPMSLKGRASHDPVIVWLEIPGVNSCHACMYSMDGTDCCFWLESPWSLWISRSCMIGLPRRSKDMGLSHLLPSCVL
jgi:hypothetical protein